MESAGNPRQGINSAYDTETVRAQFPALHQLVGDKPLVYLDNAASTQKPRAVIDAISHYYEHDHANVHRGVHMLSVRATEAFEEAREAVRSFIGAPSVNEVVFTRGTTEAINLVAASWGGANLREGDEILLSGMEHHANIVPWQLIAQRTGAVVRAIPVRDDGTLDLEAYERMLSKRVKLVGCVHVSNALGTVNPVTEIVSRAKSVGARVLIDGAQATLHQPVDVRAIGCDFYAFSGHKVYGPTGIGALIGTAEVLESMPPWQGGGEMIRTVSFDSSTYAAAPARFEAGTPNIAGTVGLSAALKWVTALGLERASAHEASLLAAATRGALQLPGLRVIGTAPEKAGVLSFVVEGVNAGDLGELLDRQGVAVRTGHHCAQPLMARFGVTATARASFAAYNTHAEVEIFLAALEKAIRMLR